MTVKLIDTKNHPFMVCVYPERHFRFRWRFEEWLEKNLLEPPKENEMAYMQPLDAPKYYCFPVRNEEDLMTVQIAHS